MMQYFIGNKKITINHKLILYSLPKMLLTISIYFLIYIYLHLRLVFNRTENLFNFITEFITENLFNFYRRNCKNNK